MSTLGASFLLTRKSSDEKVGVGPAVAADRLLPSHTCQVSGHTDRDRGFAKVHLGPNDNRDDENAPAFRVFVGLSGSVTPGRPVQAATSPKDYLHGRLDDPSLCEPTGVALFLPTEGKEAPLVWNRR